MAHLINITNMLLFDILLQENVLILIIIYNTMKPELLIIYVAGLALVFCEKDKVQQTAHGHTVYHLVPDYNTYHKMFASNAGSANTIEVTALGTGKQLCKRTQACRFYIYTYEPENKSHISNTVLMVSGMHGNQLIGPTSLLYAYPLLKPSHTRIIYFPISNPSGYDLKQRQTYPQNVDLNRDYPIDNNTVCYQGSATRILDSIFRNYSIDLTVSLHNGGDEIAWNWGTYYHQKFPQTQNQIIYAPIGAMLKLYGGYNQRMKIQQFKIGTMDEVVYPAEGTFDDWAYAASWAESVPPKCQNYTYSPYPKQMHKGLVFLMELGIHNAPQGLLGTSDGLDKPSISNQTNNGYVTRTLRMLRQLIKVVQPILLAQFSGSKLLLKVEGCKKIDLLHIQTPKSQIRKQKQIKVNLNITDFVNPKDSFSFIAQLSIQQLLGQDSDFTLNISYTLECDKNWVGKGKTFLSKPRIFTGNLSIIKQDNRKENKDILLKINGQKTDMNAKQYIFMVIPFILFILITYMILCRNKCKKRNKNKHPNAKTATHHNLDTQNSYESYELSQQDNSEPI